MRTWWIGVAAVAGGVLMASGASSGGAQTTASGALATRRAAAATRAATTRAATTPPRPYRPGDVVEGETRLWTARSVGLSVFTPDGRHFAYVDDSAIKTLMLDGKAAAQFPGNEKISNLMISADGQRLSYLMESTQGDFTVVAGDKTYGPYISFYKDSLIFSRDGSRCAFVCHRKDLSRKTISVVDGKEYDGSSQDGKPSFSEDGKHVVWGGSVDNKAALIVDGKAVPVTVVRDATKVTAVAYGPKDRLAYSTEQTGSDLANVVVDGKMIGGHLGRVTLLCFSPDGKHLAFLVQAGPIFHGTSYLVLDGKKGDTFDYIVPESIRFSPDGTHLAYIGRREADVQMVVDGKAEAKYAKMSRIIFSPDSKRWAYSAAPEKGDLVMGDWVMMVDGKPGGEYSGPNGDRTDELREYVTFWVSSEMEKGERKFRMHGWSFGGLGVPVFSADSKYLAFTACKKGSKPGVIVVADGTVVGDYPSENVLPESVRFYDQGAVEFLAVRGVSLFRVKPKRP